MIGSPERRRWTLAGAIALIAVLASFVIAAPAQAAGTGTIHGRLLLASGQPYSNSEVSVYSLAGVGVAGPSLSFDDGSFTFAGLAPGSYRLEVRSGDETINAINPYWFGGQSLGTGPVYAVSADQVRELGTITVPDGAVVSGSISTDDANPNLAAPFISLYGADGLVKYGINASGSSYSIAGIRPGSYRVGFSDTQRSDLYEQFWNNQTTLATATSIGLTAGQTVSGIDAVLHGRPKLRGTLSGMAQNGTTVPIHRGVVEVWTPSGDEIGSGETAADGTWAVPVEPGQYTIEFLSNQPAYAPQWYGGERFAETSTVVNVGTSGVSGIDATLALPSSISGHVRRGAGSAPLTDLIVWALAQAPSGTRHILSGGWVASDGSFLIDQLPAGDVILQIEDTGATGNPTSYYPNATAAAGAQVIPVGTGQQVSGFDQGVFGGPLVIAAGSAVQIGSARYLTDGEGGLVSMPDPAVGVDMGLNSGTSVWDSVPASTTVYGPLTNVLACGPGGTWIAADGEITDLGMAGGAVSGWPHVQVPDSLCNVLTHGTAFQPGYAPLYEPQQVFLRARDTGVVYWAYEGHTRPVTPAQISMIDSYSPSRIMTLNGAYLRARPQNPSLGAPELGIAPAVFGSAAVGSTWVVDAGTWYSVLGAPSFVQAWLRCDAPVTTVFTTVPVGCTAIPDARGATYQSTSADAGKYLTAQLAAIDNLGSTLSGAPTTVATDGPVAPVNTLAPSVSGSVAVGSTWTLSTGTWTGTPAPTFVQAWLRCAGPVSAAFTTVPAGCVAIPGARATSYVSIAADAGKYLTAQLAATNSAASVLSGAPTTVATNGPIAPMNTVAPSVSGLAAVGSTWTLSTGTWTGTPAPTFVQAWLRCSAPVTTAFTTVPVGCTAIAGARSTSYVSTLADAGKYLTAQLAATNSAASVLSGAPTTVATAGPVAPVNSVAPSVSGSTAVGSTWTLSTGTWTGTPAPTFVQAWLRCAGPVTVFAAVPVGCTAIPDARATSYVSTSADAGKYLTAQLAAVNSAATVLLGAPTTVATDGPVAAVNTVAPSVSGLAAVGSTWTLSTGTWTGTPAPVFVQAWLRCSVPVTTAFTAVPAGCTAIPGARGASYVSTQADVGTYLTAQLAATNSAASVLSGAPTTIATG